MAGVAEPKLTNEAKAFVVCALACFESPATVAASVKREFDIKVSPQAMEVYDPTKRMGRRLSAEYRELFEKTRAEFIEDAKNVSVAHRGARLRRLDRMSIRAEEAGNLALAAQLLKQAAEECGDVFTNRHKIEASVTNRIDPRDMSDDELAAIAAGGST